MRKSVFAFIVVIVVLVSFILAQNLGLVHSFHGGVENSNPIDLGAAEVNFTSLELQKWTSVKERITVYNADPEFKGNRVLQWISMRNSSSGDYYQKSMEYLCFWEGQGANGEWQAVVSIYNSPDSTTDFVVEAARFTWHRIQIWLDGEVKVDFPQVRNDTVSLGYCTFQVTV